jgi:UDP-N-acetylmuramoylalanine--D-glutamate ligase
VIDLKQLDRLDFAGKNVTVVGLGIEGVDFVRYLARRGANVTISDSKSRDKLADRLRDVAGLPVSLSLGGNDNAAVTEADAVFVSQSVPLDLPAIRQAKMHGIPLHSMVGLFLELAPGPVVGITGSSGKTTTTALVAEMLRADERPVFVGGNIGVGLLEHVQALRPYTWSVLEVSHTQLQLVDCSPHIAAVLNITPNHLDRFSWDDYRRLKSNLIRYQAPEDIAILGYDDPETRALQSEVRGRLLWFTMQDNISPGQSSVAPRPRSGRGVGGEGIGEGVFVHDGVATARNDGRDQPLFALDTVAIRGRHNQENAVAAAAIAIACGVSPDAIAVAVAAFRGVPHRLEFVGEVDGAKYYNDSIATTPERTLAGLRSFEEPVVLLLGGRDKQLPLDDMAREALKRCRGVVVFGESADLLQEALSRQSNPRHVPIARVATLAEAVASAHGIARPGDVVLLSPSCTSYDAYENFERRGEHFRELVAEVRP